MKRTLILLICWLLSATASAAIYTLNYQKKSLLSDGKMHVFLCGTGDPEPSMQALRHPACVAIVANKQFFVVDAGGAAIQTIAALGLPFSELYTVFITHWHSDHFGGLAQIINETWLANRSQPIEVYGPKGVKKVLAGIKKAYSLDAKYRVKNRHGALKKNLAFALPKEVKGIPSGAQIYKNGDITIHAFKVNHNPAEPALGYRIQYKGCKLVISGDTKVIKSLGENSKNADVLINEAFSQYDYEIEKTQALKHSKNPKLSLAFLNETKHYHSDTIELAKMAQKYKVKHLFLTHLIPSIGTTPAMKETFMTGMKQFYKGPLIVADDRDEIVLDYSHGKCKVTYLPAKQPDVKLYKIKRP